MNWLLRFIATGFFVGEKVPFAPGTAGTALAALIYFLFFPVEAGFYWPMLLLVTFIGIISAGRTEEIMKEIDPPQVVIDEILGYFIAMAFLPKTFGLALAGFIIFRFFDILKIFPINKLEIVAGGLGIMIDDICAGIMTNIILQLAVRFF